MVANMARIDDYKQARELAKNELKDLDPDLLSLLSEAGYPKEKDGRKGLILDFLNREVFITWPDMDIIYSDANDELSIQQQVLILHYFNGCFISNGAPLTGEWISFQEIPDGRFYMGPFFKRAKDPLLKTFGEKPGLLIDIASKEYEASPFDHGDFSVIINAFPLVPIALVLWEGDEEFPPEGNVLFDKNISKILSAEDVAWLAGMAIYPMIGMANK